MAIMAPRSSDEALLRALGLRRLGFTAREIAAETGIPKNTIKTTLPRIRADDMRLSGEPPEEVAAAYDRKAGR